MKKNIYIIALAICITSNILGAENQPSIPNLDKQNTALLEDDNALDDIDPNVVPPEPDPTITTKLRILSEYLVLQAELAKQHISDHKKNYLIGTLLVLGILTASGISYNIAKKTNII